MEEEYLTGLTAGWTTLCLCPNCAAELKYGDVSLGNFSEWVKTREINLNYRDMYEYEIQMQGDKRILHYTPRHLLSLKSALDLFEKQKEKSRTEDIVHTVKSSTQYYTGELNGNIQKE